MPRKFKPGDIVRLRKDKRSVNAVKEGRTCFFGAVWKRAFKQKWLKVLMWNGQYQHYNCGTVAQGLPCGYWYPGELELVERAKKGGAR